MTLGKGAETVAYHVIGVDLGGTTFSVAAVGPDGTVLHESTFSTRKEEGASAIIQRMGDAIAEVSKQAEGRGAGPCKAIGLGVPGLHDYAAGICRYASNLQWYDVPVVAPIAERFGIPVAMDNDVRCAALGEFHFGAGKGIHDMALVTLGTGLGGAFVSGGHILRGSGFAGEIGHQTINMDGPLCSCGNSGCLEAYVGIAGIVGRARAYYLRDGATIPADLVHSAGQALEKLAPYHLFRAAQQGDEIALRVWTEVGRYLGVGIANVVNLLHPQRIAVGGGVARAWEFFAPAMLTEVQRRCPAVTAAGTEVLPALLGSSAGVVGAATLGQRASVQ